MARCELGLIGAFDVACVVVLAATSMGQTGYPHAPVPFTDVQVDGAFWSPRIETNRTKTIPFAMRKCAETGRIANFARAGRLDEGPFQGIAFNDSDVAKVIEALLRDGYSGGILEWKVR